VCGIIGWASDNARAGDQALLTRLTDLLAHRGPDGSGSLVIETLDGRHRIALGHRRLSIIDHAGGTQPMQSEDGKIVLIQNGEIYNYVELREELRSLGHVFQTQSDTEVIIAAWRAWGPGALNRLRGMFAFTLWDHDAQQLFLARDPFGKKPIFFVEQPGRLLFSSEIAPLLEHPDVSRDIDPGAVAQYLLNRYVPGPSTFFRAIRKLQPGSLLSWKVGAITIERYFTPPLAKLEPQFTDFHEAVGAFSTVFAEAVRIRMRSDAPYGAFLSGGIDSSAVVAEMSKRATQLRTFSVGFDDEASSELAYARDIARLFATEHEELVVSPDAFFENLPSAIRARGAPVSEPSDIPIMMLSRAAARTVKMVLTGEGADEMLGGYPKHRAEGWVEVYQRLIPGALHNTIAGPIARALPYEGRRLRHVANVAGERDASMRARAWFGGITRDERAALLGSDGFVSLPDPLPFALATRSALRRTLFFDQTSWLPDNLLERGDRMMMANSLEGRMPFMDTELAATAARMPDRFLIGGKGGKRVLRAAMHNTLPAHILHRRKIGFRVPVDAWFRGRHREFVRGVLLSKETLVGAFCDPREMTRLANEHIAARHNNERILWTLVNLELFLREYRPTGLPTLESRRCEDYATVDLPSSAERQAASRIGTTAL